MASKSRTEYSLADYIQWFFAVGLILALLKVGADVLAFPSIVRTAGAQAWLYLGLFVLALLFYAGVAKWMVGAATAQTLTLRRGLMWGSLCGAAWTIEICVANLGWMVPQFKGLIDLLYAGTTILGYLLPGVAGYQIARQTRNLRAGITSGVLCGTLAALILILSYSALSLLLLQVGQHDPQMLREFQSSGASDLSTYLVGDYLAALIAHLWIGLLTGVICGAVGGGLGMVFDSAVTK